MISLAAIASALGTTATRWAIIGTAGVTVVASSYWLGRWHGSSRAALRAEIASVEAERDAARRDLAIFRRDADLAAQQAIARARSAEDRASRLQNYLTSIEADEAARRRDGDVCPPCRDRVLDGDADRLRDLAR